MLKFALKNMLIKRVKMILIVLSIIISACIGILAFNISQQVEDGIVNTAAYYDIIIGPSGSATQLAMNTMFFTDTPLGTIPYSIVEDLQNDTRVNVAVPFAMGDNYNGYKIVGTSPEYLDSKGLIEGEMFYDNFEAVIGCNVAKSYNLTIGDELVTSHGLSEGGAEHASTPLKVVGILKETKTAYDNVLFTSIQTIWAVHDHSHHDNETESKDNKEHDGEEANSHVEDGTVCAILVKSKNFNSYSSLTETYSQDSKLLAINPSTVLREVLENVDLSKEIVYILCVIIVIMNIFVISVVTLLNMYDSKKEISLMRLIGIGMRKINLLYIIQNGIIGLISIILAFGASRLCLYGMSSFVASMGIVLDHSKTYSLELIILSIVLVISVLPTIVCTFSMSRRDSILN